MKAAATGSRRGYLEECSATTAAAVTATGSTDAIADLLKTTIVDPLLKTAIVDLLKTAIVDTLLKTQLLFPNHSLINPYNPPTEKQEKM